MYRHFLPFLTNFIDKTFLDRYFPKELKKAEIISVQTKNDTLRKDNYSAVTLLPHVSKIFERFIYKQINIYMCDKLSKQVLENVMERSIRY